MLDTGHSMLAKAIASLYHIKYNW